MGRYQGRDLFTQTLLCAAPSSQVLLHHQSIWKKGEAVEAAEPGVGGSKLLLLYRGGGWRGSLSPLRSPDLSPAESGCPNLSDSQAKFHSGLRVYGADWQFLHSEPSIQVWLHMASNWQQGIQGMNRIPGTKRDAPLSLGGGVVYVRVK